MWKPPRPLWKSAKDTKPSWTARPWRLGGYERPGQRGHGVTLGLYAENLSDLYDLVKKLEEAGNKFGAGRHRQDRQRKPWPMPSSSPDRF